MKFMTGAFVTIDGAQCYVTRSGYTGGDGYEISTPADKAEAIARLLLAQPEVKPIGLGARNSLRLEAGLCLYGHDIDTTTTPIEAVLLWSIGKERRTQGGFPGAAVIQKQIAEGAPRKRVGLLPEGKAIAREGTRDRDRRQGDRQGHRRRLRARRLGRAVAMGYVEKAAFSQRHQGRIAGARQACAGRDRADAFRQTRLLPRIGRRRDEPSNTARITSGSASRATSAPSASPAMPRSSWATWCSSTCRRPAARSPRASRSPWSNWSRPRPTSIRRPRAR